MGDRFVQGMLQLVRGRYVFCLCVVVDLRRHKEPMELGDVFRTATPPADFTCLMFSRALLESAGGCNTQGASP
jgi:hypothetical protein